ncbi:MAG: OsmC family protein [Gammaproteobacteria bacterium]|nr:OsmC family protein [Gammaproteobacteria bacterium]
MSQTNVKQALLKTIEGIKANPKMSKVIFRAETELVEDVRCRIKIRDFDPITVDEPPELGGKDAGVNPVELVLAALGTCQEIMYSAYASVMDIPLDGVRVNVRGYLDLKGMFGLDESVPSGYERITFEAEIDSSADDESLRKLVEVVESHCPVMDILCRAQKISGVVKVDGREIHSLQSKAA